MSKLQKEIAEEVNNAMERAIALEQAGVMSRSEADPVADRILALIAEAMLSEEAVDAGEMVLIRDEWAKANRAKSFNVIETALAAAGITGAGQEGGEGE